MIVVSNRTPGAVAPRDAGGRPSGGLEVVLTPLTGRPDVRWLSPMTLPEADALDPEVLERFSVRTCSSMLWFVLHGAAQFAELRDRSPGSADWLSYVAVNTAMAAQVAASAKHGDVVLVNDFHFMLVPGLLARSRPDLRVTYVHHVPFPTPEQLAILPVTVAAQLLTSLAAAPVVFLAQRWQDAYLESAAVLGLSPRASTVLPVAPDPAVLRRQAATDDVVAAASALRARAGGRAVVVALARLDPVKGLIGVCRALDRYFLDTPGAHERVLLRIQTAPTRESSPVYLRYRDELCRAVADLNTRWGTPDRAVAELAIEPGGSASVASLQEYDVLVVNSMADGMNLVCVEGLLLNRRDGVVVLSSRTGASQVIGDACLVLSGGGDAHEHAGELAGVLGSALALPGDERRRHRDGVHERLAALAPPAWVDAVVSFAERAGDGSAAELATELATELAS